VLLCTLYPCVLLRTRVRSRRALICPWPGCHHVESRRALKWSVLTVATGRRPKHETLYYYALRCTVMYYRVLLCTTVYYCALLRIIVRRCVLLCTTVYYCLLLFTIVHCYHFLLPTHPSICARRTVICARRILPRKQQAPQTLTKWPTEEGGWAGEICDTRETISAPYENKLSAQICKNTISIQEKSTTKTQFFDPSS